MKGGCGRPSFISSRYCRRAAVAIARRESERPNASHRPSPPVSLAAVLVAARANCSRAFDPRPRCEACGLDYAFADAGDGPAVFVILFAGFIVVFAALIVESLYQPPFWLHALLWIPLILLVTLLPLRPVKGAPDRAAIPSQGGGRPGRKRRPDVNAVRTLGGWRRLLVPAIVTAVALAVLIGLGIWQLDRKAWKEALIAALEQRTSAAPAKLPPPETWATLTPENSDSAASSCSSNFSIGAMPGSTPAARPCAKTSRVRVISCSFRRDFPTGRLSSSTPAMPPSGNIRGRRARPRSSAICAGPNPPLGSFPSTTHPEAPGSCATNGRWPRSEHGVTWRRSTSIEEGPVPPGGPLRPGAVQVNLRNDHLGYALTRFGRPAALAAIFALWAWKELSRRCFARRKPLRL